MDDTPFDAVIVGAGPAGASAAILLARAGWRIALVEKQRFPRRKVCGECIAASNLALLDALGVGAAFDAVAGPALRRVALLRGDSAAVADLPAGADARHPWGRALGRETLDTMLAAQARSAGAQLLQPWSVQAIDGEPGEWRFELRSVDTGAPRRLHARVAIAAHGSWEVLPSHRAQRRGTRSAADLFAFKAGFRGAALAGGVLPVLAFDGGYGGMVLGDGGTTTLACCVRRDRLDELRSAADDARAGSVVEAMLRRSCAGVRDALRDAVRDGPWLAAGPIDPGVRLRGDDTVFRIGNAAGEAHPILGEGISMALQSAWLLSAQLLRARPADAQSQSTRPRDAAFDARSGAALHGAGWQRDAARRYAAQWRAAFVPRLHVAAAFAHLAMRPACAAPLVALVRPWPALLTLGARLGGKVRCAADADTIARLAPAARFSDAP